MASGANATATAVPALKESLRRHIKQLLRQQHPDTTLAENRNICAHLLGAVSASIRQQPPQHQQQQQLIESQHNIGGSGTTVYLRSVFPARFSSVGVFAAMRTPPAKVPEVDLSEFVFALLAEGKHRCYVPQMQPPPAISLRFLHIPTARDFRDLPLNNWGIPEPPPDSLLINGLPLGDPDVVIVPGLAFDPSCGARLGRGKGYYDRYILELQQARAARDLPPPVLVGVAFSSQLATPVPCDRFDVRVNALCTTTGFSMFDEQNNNTDDEELRQQQ
eukprot:gnl/Spiro4/12420_TR6560_c0_g1_i1.p1 gnl/Spiro4/12420_TR6560_c0_g1~~gnl/Spiro4/12420_TR6560_c0_g1_i1.p1  ORF type:complete len:276 (-),score=37.36 gnl/Spiro4/12420_TR6560_c0_g1_i1:101-928(-)